MESIGSPEELRERCDAARASGHMVGFVPTMGALHEGHLSLVDRARARGATFVVVSIFVNPLQFGPDEDFDRYPRVLHQDVEACRTRGVDIIFAPARETLYPSGFATRITVDGLTKRWEGFYRPDHFQGVTTVVGLLFQLVGPSTAVFGRKDYQQWKVVERLARDLFPFVDVIGAPIVRDHDGLAMSSRNRYLSPAERRRAQCIPRALAAASAAYGRGVNEESVLRSLIVDTLNEGVDAIDYVAIADPDTLEPLDGTLPGRTLIAVAAHVEATRLIDNTVLGEDAPPRLSSTPRREL